MSLNQFVATVLAEAIGRRTAMTNTSNSSGEIEPSFLCQMVDLHLHEKWAFALKSGLHVSVFEDTSSLGDLCEKISFFANRVPRRATASLKAMQNDTTKKNTQLASV